MQEREKRQTSDYRRQIEQGENKLVVALGLSHKRSERCNGLCTLASFAMLRPDLVDAEIASRIISSDDASIVTFIEALHLTDIFIPVRLSHKRASGFDTFRKLIIDPHIAGIVAIVPNTYHKEDDAFEILKEGKLSADTIDLTSEGTHAMAVIGRLRDVNPAKYRQIISMTRKLNGRWAKERRRRTVVVADISDFSSSKDAEADLDLQENVTKRDMWYVTVDDSRRFIEAMSRVPGKNALVVLARGYRYDWETRKIVADL